MIVDKVLIEKISELSKIGLKDNELKAYSDQLSRILEHMKALDEVDVTNVLPMFHGCIEDQELALDRIKIFDSTKITGTSPFMEKGLYCVPSILGDEN